MVDDDATIIVVLACVAAVHQLKTAYSIFFNDVPIVRERKGYLKSISMSLHPTKGMFLLDTLPRWSHPRDCFLVNIKC
jgi:hypothetical protein